MVTAAAEGDGVWVIVVAMATVVTVVSTSTAGLGQPDISEIIVLVEVDGSIDASVEWSMTTQSTCKHKILGCYLMAI